MNDEVIFLAKNENGKASVFSTDGKSVKNLSNHDEEQKEFFNNYNTMVLSKEFKKYLTEMMQRYYPGINKKHYFKSIQLFDPNGNLIPYHEYIKLYENGDSNEE